MNALLFQMVSKLTEKNKVYRRVAESAEHLAAGRWGCTALYRPPILCRSLASLRRAQVEVEIAETEAAKDPVNIFKSARHMFNVPQEGRAGAGPGEADRRKHQKLLCLLKS